jgi:branched-chain amino acid transport system permease protein
MACVVIVAVLPLLLSDFWVGLLALGAAYAVVFLSITLVTGEGGMLWLCEVTFAGFGAITTGQLAATYHWPILLAVLVGGLVAALFGAVIGLLTIRLGDLYVALVTLTFGLLADNLIFVRPRFTNSGSGVLVNPPHFAHSYKALAYLMLAAFCLMAFLVVRLRRSTLGLAVTAVRWSEDGAKTVGISVFRMKMLVAISAAFMAGIGGGLLSVYTGSAIPSNYGTLIGVVWLAVLVTNGVRSLGAALVAGMSFSIIPALVVNYLPQSWAELSTAFFGIGAIVAARNPEGILLKNAEELSRLIRTLGRRRLQPAQAGVLPGASDPSPSTQPQTAGTPGKVVVK